MKKKIRLNAFYPGKQNHVAFFSVISYLIPVSLFFLASAFFLLNSFSIFDFPLDDAWIHRVYSRSFAFGNGFQYNNGIQEAGQTSPLWAIISSPAHWIERLWGTKAMVVVVKLIGFALGIIIITTVRKMTEVISHSQMLGMVTASLLALEPRLLFSAFSGMENILLIALWITATYQFIKKKMGDIIPFIRADSDNPTRSINRTSHLYPDIIFSGKKGISKTSCGMGRITFTFSAVEHLLQIYQWSFFAEYLLFKIPAFFPGLQSDRNFVESTITARVCFPVYFSCGYYFLHFIFFKM